MMSSCSAGLVQNDQWWSSHLMDRKASDLRESDGKGMMSSCSAGLVKYADCCWSSHLMDKEGTLFERI